MLWARQSTTVCTLRVVPSVNDDERGDCDGRWRCRQLLVGSHLCWLLCLLPTPWLEAMRSFEVTSGEVPSNGSELAVNTGCVF